MRYQDIKPLDVANGDGIRVTIFVSGCTIGCKGCFNLEAQDFNKGDIVTEETYEELEELLNKPAIQGLTVLGGEPMDNAKGVLNLLKSLNKGIRERNQDVWLFTGHYMEELKGVQKEVLDYVDVVIDSPFELENYAPDLYFRGSTNQRMWVKENNKWIIKENIDE